MFDLLDLTVPFTHNLARCNMIRSHILDCVLNYTSCVERELVRYCLSLISLHFKHGLNEAWSGAAGSYWFTCLTAF